MKKIITTVLVLLVIVLLAQCQSQNTESESNKAEQKKEKPVMYEESELAALMHEVHDLSAEWKQQLENGEPLTPIPDWVSDVLTAEATNPSELEGGAFTPLAEEYLRKLELLAKAEGEGRVDAFNESIQTCISCHQLYCNGPIPKIKKLKI